MGRENWVKRVSMILSGMVICLMTVGCGGGGYSESATTESAANYDYNYEYSDEVYEEDAISEKSYEGEPASEEKSNEAEPSSDRKLIRNVSMSVETEQFDALVVNVTAKTKELGGYIENSTVWNNNYYTYSDNTESTRQAEYRIRIPKDKLDSFISLVEDGTNVVRKEESVDDVTLTYVDLESHKKALLAEQERLLELLDEAIDMESILSIEERLTQVRYQIESMESQLRTYDNQVDYATLTLNIEEVARITAVDKESVWTEISTGFSNSLYSVGRGIRNFIVAFIIHLPQIFVFLVIVVPISLIFIRLGRTGSVRGKRKDKKKAGATDEGQKASEIQNTDADKKA